MTIARKQLSTAMLDYGECPEAVIFEFKEPIIIIERSGPRTAGTFKYGFDERILFCSKKRADESDWQERRVMCWSVYPSRPVGKNRRTKEQPKRCGQVCWL